MSYNCTNYYTWHRPIHGRRSVTVTPDGALGWYVNSTLPVASPVAGLSRSPALLHCRGRRRAVATVVVVAVGLGVSTTLGRNTTPHTSHYTTLHYATLQDTTQHSATQRSTTQDNATQRSEAQRNAIQQLGIHALASKPMLAHESRDQVPASHRRTVKLCMAVV